MRDGITHEASTDQERTSLVSQGDSDSMNENNHLIYMFLKDYNPFNMGITEPTFRNKNALRNA